jgi:hypothetical protein
MLAASTRLLLNDTSSSCWVCMLSVACISSARTAMMCTHDRPPCRKRARVRKTLAQLTSACRDAMSVASAHPTDMPTCSHTPHVEQNPEKQTPLIQATLTGLMKESPAYTHPPYRTPQELQPMLTLSLASSNVTRMPCVQSSTLSVQPVQMDSTTSTHADCPPEQLQPLMPSLSKTARQPC